MNVSYRDPVDFYRDHGLKFDKVRPQSFYEKDWLDDLLKPHPNNACVLDAGCGAGYPIGSYIANAGFELVGIDSSRAMLDLAVDRIVSGKFVEGDLRNFELPERFDAIVAWDSFFHLSANSQRDALVRFSKHLKSRATLLFTTGHIAGEAINPMFGEPLYHASLAPTEYHQHLTDLGFSVLRYAEQDPNYGARTIWLAGRGLET